MCQSSVRQVCNSLGKSQNEAVPTCILTRVETQHSLSAFSQQFRDFPWRNRNEKLPQTLLHDRPSNHVHRSRVCGRNKRTSVQHRSRRDEYSAMHGAGRSTNFVLHRSRRRTHAGTFNCADARLRIERRNCHSALRNSSGSLTDHQVYLECWRGSPSQCTIVHAPSETLRSPGPY